MLCSLGRLEENRQQTQAAGTVADLSASNFPIGLVFVSGATGRAACADPGTRSAAFARPLSCPWLFDMVKIEIRRDTWGGARPGFARAGPGAIGAGQSDGRKMTKLTRCASQRLTFVSFGAAGRERAAPRPASFPRGRAHDGRRARANGNHDFHELYLGGDTLLPRRGDARERIQRMLPLFQREAPER